MVRTKRPKIPALAFSSWPLASYTRVISAILWIFKSTKVLHLGQQVEIPVRRSANSGCPVNNAHRHSSYFTAFLSADYNEWYALMVGMSVGLCEMAKE